MDIITDKDFDAACEAARQTKDYREEVKRINAELAEERAAAESLLAEPKFVDVSKSHKGFVRYHEPSDSLFCFVIDERNQLKCVATHVKGIGEARRILKNEHGVSKGQLSVRFTSQMQNARKTRERKIVKAATGGVTKEQIGKLNQVVERTNRLMREISAFASFLPNADWNAPASMQTSIANLTSDLKMMRDATQYDLDKLNKSIEQYKDEHNLHHEHEHNLRSV